ncbi:Leucine-zipper-like transcriptional regulator 1 [Perkinsus chesapeaki]|uniref:Leucine-zipper-like transcriptional regulator 1 n=1 Tax=Perkinsus chesapeaki TaxID=330153 RepID=A0A7J6LTZ3_PERCH|nr:Leucine-zipper-like transcriptional regulator 1 [Perkinsus chesapeaki]
MDTSAGGGTPPSADRTTGAGDVFDRASGVARPNARLPRYYGGGASAAGGCETTLGSNPAYGRSGGGGPSAKTVIRRWRPVQYSCSSEMKSMELPGDRSGAASVVYKDALYVLGGYGGSGRLDDLFRFDFNTRLWSQVHTKGETPTGRENNGAVVIGNKMYLFGGYSGYNWLNDFHYFCFDTSTWAPVEVKEGSPPSTRFGYVSSVHGSVFFVFGGYDGQTWLNDMHEFDVKQATWSQTQIQGYIPTGRSCPSWAYHEGSVYLFGGYDGVHRMNDFHRFEMTARKWSVVATRSTGQPPSPRYFHASVVHGNSLYLFGGYSGQERLNDLHEFRFDLQTWFLVQTEDPPSGRSSLVAQVHNNSLYVFGGYNGSIVLNDFHEFRFDPIHVPASTMEGDLRKLMTAPEFADVAFLVDGHRLLANKALLASRSEHFCAMFYSCGLRESSVRRSRTGDGCASTSGSCSQPEIMEVPITDVDYDTFNLLLEYIYSDKVSPDLNTGEALALLITAEMFCIDRLRAICEDLVRHNVTIQNCVEILITAHHHNADGLKEICLEFLLSNEEACKHYSDGFKELIGEPQLMYELLVRRKPSMGQLCDPSGDPHRGGGGGVLSVTSSSSSWR